MSFYSTIRYEYAEDSNSSQQSAFIDPPLFNHEQQQQQQLQYHHHFLDSCDDPAMPFPSSLMMPQENEEMAAAASISRAHHQHQQQIQFSPSFNSFHNQQHEQQQLHFLNASSSSNSNYGYWQMHTGEDEQHQQQLLQNQQLHHDSYHHHHHKLRDMQSINKTPQLVDAQHYHVRQHNGKEQPQQHNIYYDHQVIDDQENIVPTTTKAAFDFGENNNFTHFHRVQRQKQQQYVGYRQDRQKQQREPLQRLHHLESSEFPTDFTAASSGLPPIPARKKEQDNYPLPQRQYKIEPPCSHDDNDDDAVLQQGMKPMQNDENKILCGPPAHWRLDEIDDPQNFAPLKHKGGRKQRSCASISSTDLSRSQDFGQQQQANLTTPNDCADDELCADESAEQGSKGILIAPNGFVKPAYSYSCLIGLSLKNSATGELTVSEIYTFLCHHFPYFREAPSGWKNSVRHNLSLNKCFKKIEVEIPGCQGRKSCLWTMNPARRAKMDQELKKWRDRDEPRILSAMECPENLDLLQNGQIGMPPNMKPRRFSVATTHDDSSLLMVHQQQKQQQRSLSNQRRLAMSGPSQLTMSQHGRQQLYRSPIRHSQQLQPQHQAQQRSMRQVHLQQRQELGQMTPSHEHRDQHLQGIKQQQTPSSENTPTEQQQHEKVPRAESIHALAARRKLENLLQRQKTSSTSAEIDTPIDPYSGMLVPLSDAAGSGGRSGAKKRRSSENASESSTSGHSSRRHSRHSNEHNNSSNSNSNNIMHHSQTSSGVEQQQQHDWQNNPGMQQTIGTSSSSVSAGSIDAAPVYNQLPFREHFEKHAVMLYHQLSGGESVEHIDDIELAQQQYHQHQLLLQQQEQQHHHQQQHAHQQDLSICVEPSQQFMQPSSSSSSMENPTTSPGLLKSILSNPITLPPPLPSPFTSSATGAGTNLGLDSCENALLLDNPLLLEWEQPKQSPK